MSDLAFAAVWVAVVGLAMTAALAICERVAAHYHEHEHHRENPS